MRILITNDDGYESLGLKVLSEIVRPMGEITVVAPKTVQSGMSMAVTIGGKPIAARKVSDEPGESWYYVDGTPASCVKYYMSILCAEGDKPGLVLSGINHGGNYASAALYSGTVGAAEEAALSGVTAVALSLDNLYPTEEDFECVRVFLPGILEKLLASPARRFGMVYNINFPAVSPERVKGVKVCAPGVIRWVREYEGWVNVPGGPVAYPEEGESLFRMQGDVELDEDNAPDCDVNLIAEDWITVTALNIMSFDADENERLRGLKLGVR